LTDLRLSVTDRCNFRCTYCMPRDKLGPVVAAAPRDELLSFEELTQIASAFTDLGVRKIRITGGEPLVRQDLPQLVEQLRQLAIPDLCLTTNGSLLAGQARALAAAGLGRVTVSLDALDETTFRRMADTHISLSKVLGGIEAARAAGLSPVKINMVVQRNINEHCIIPMARWARLEGLELRFIEYMDVGCSNGWHPQDVVSAETIRHRIHEHWPIDPAQSNEPFETAVRFRYRDGAGQIGIIASISQPFCRSCTRARVSSKGELYTCLFSPVGFSLAEPMRQGLDLRQVIANLWRERADRYSELRTAEPTPHPRPEMSAIGG
jgi:cyclic pyranopterin phosphate synthase